jgi:uncharacterized protein (DUF1800 family)
MVWKSQDRSWGGAHRLAAASLLTGLLLACGGGGGGGEEFVSSPPPGPPPAELSAAQVDAVRFLTQATFGPTDAEVARVVAMGYSAWLDEQFAMPAASSHRATFEAADAAARARDPENGAEGDAVINSFYRQALSGPDQLRQRVVFALSQILVISMVDNAVSDHPRGVADYLDTLARGAFGNYRNLLEAVSLHPMMGLYLSHLHNQKEDPASGRVPDENYAREVMQLFSIGLYELAPDGSMRLGSGAAAETYTSEDVSGLAKVFTGWSWFGPDTSEARFYGYSSARDPDREWKPMIDYPRYHSTSEKRFLGKTASSTSPAADLKVALDALFAHPNVGPFIGRQLIQRLVTSNPSPAYVSRVAAAFADNGRGVRGDLRAVVRAVLLDPEARDPAKAADGRFGKLREPVLRLTAFLRAFGASSDSGGYLLPATDDPGTQLGQTPLRSPSVFNFYRPGYVPPNTRAASVSMVVPEMQITHESSVAGYANFMRSAVQNGVGQNGPDFKAARRDLQPDYSAELAVADQSATLVHRVTDKLITGPVSQALRQEIQAGVDSIAMPLLRVDGSNQQQFDTIKRNRVMLAIYMTLMAPEFIVQK